MTDAEIIVALAERVMGWECKSPQYGTMFYENGAPRRMLWQPLIYIEDAWMLVRAMTERGVALNINNRDAIGEPNFRPADWHCCFSSAPIYSGANTATDPRYHHGHGDTVIRAICMAALAAAGVKG